MYWYIEWLFVCRFTYLAIELKALSLNIISFIMFSPLNISCWSCFPLNWAARLVLALGAETKLDTVPGSAEYAIPFSTLEDACVSNRGFLFFGKYGSIPFVFFPVYNFCFSIQDVGCQGDSCMFEWCFLFSWCLKLKISMSCLCYGNYFAFWG